MTDGKKTKLGFWRSTKSVLWAMLGVQKRTNASEDFEQGSPAMFIGIGVVFGVLFVLTLVLIVKVVLSQI